MALAAQNVHPEPKGAFTGESRPRPCSETSAASYAIVGHSERRTLYGEKATPSWHRRPPRCSPRTSGRSCASGRASSSASRGGLPRSSRHSSSGSLAEVPRERATEIVVAYEPIWAIGTGKTATPEMAQEVHAVIRAALLSGSFGKTGDAIRIQYGGSVKPDNAGDPDGPAGHRRCARRRRQPRARELRRRFARAGETA